MCLQTGLVVLFLLLSLGGLEDLLRGPVAVGWRIRICDANIKDSRSTALPKAMGTDVTPECWRQLRTCFSCFCGLPGDGDFRFRRDVAGFEGNCAKVMPLLSEVVMSRVDQSSLLAVESVFNSEALTALAAIAA